MFDDTSDLNDDPPTDIAANVRGLRPARVLWCRFVAWQHKTDHELKELESRRADIEAKLGKAEAEIKAAVRWTPIGS
jgi:hypothetical protein